MGWWGCPATTSRIVRDAEAGVHHDEDEGAVGFEEFAAGLPDGGERGDVLDGEDEGDGVEGSARLRDRAAVTSG